MKKTITHFSFVMMGVTLCTIFLTSIVASVLFFTSCIHPAPPPSPILSFDGGYPYDGPPADCAKFSGRYILTNSPIATIGTCNKPVVTKSIITVQTDGDRDPASGQWNTLVFDGNGTQWVGLAKQIEDRPYLCRFVVELPGGQPETGTNVVNLDFIFGQVPNNGIGESIIKSDSCLWQGVLTLTATK